MNKIELDRLFAELVVEIDGKKKLSCAKAFKIHAEHDVSLSDIGKFCNQQGIKIMNCQLGCFK